MNNIKFARRYLSFKNLPPILTTDLSSKMEHFRLFDISVRDLKDWIFHGSGLADSVLSLGHPFPLTLYNLISSSEGT